MAGCFELDFAETFLWLAGVAELFFEEIFFPETFFELFFLECVVGGGAVITFAVAFSVEVAFSSLGRTFDFRVALLAAALSGEAFRGEVDGVNESNFLRVADDVDFGAVDFAELEVFLDATEGEFGCGPRDIFSEDLGVDFAEIFLPCAVFTTLRAAGLLR